MALKRIEFKRYAGLKIKGTINVLEDDLVSLVAPAIETRHIQRAFMVTFLVESGGLFGGVMNYDGTAMTAGACQNILVYPRELAHEDFNAEDDQGPLGKLLRRLEVIPGLYAAFDDLWDLVENEGWYLSQDGQLRWIDSGEHSIGKKVLPHLAGNVVHGAVLRDTITGPRGVLPVHGERRRRSSEWIRAFAKVFSHPESFFAQAEYEMEHIVKFATRRKLRGSWNTIQDLVYGDTHVSRIEVGEADLMLEVDLAMCMFWSNSVNAPGKAKRVIEKCLPCTDGLTFARKLIRGLGNTSFGRWDDDIKNGRYQRTRRAMRRLKLWPESFFKPKGIMPVNLPG